MYPDNLHLHSIFSKLVYMKLNFNEKYYNSYNSVSSFILLSLNFLLIFLNVYWVNEIINLKIHIYIFFSQLVLFSIFYLIIFYFYKKLV